MESLAESAPVSSNHLSDLCKSHPPIKLSEDAVLVEPAKPHTDYRLRIADENPQLCFSGLTNHPRYMKGPHKDVIPGFVRPGSRPTTDTRAAGRPSGFFDPRSVEDVASECSLASLVRCIRIHPLEHHDKKPSRQVRMSMVSVTLAFRTWWQTPRLR